jgi:hypothetical protein
VPGVPIKLNDDTATKEYIRKNLRAGKVEIQNVLYQPFYSVNDIINKVNALSSGDFLSLDDEYFNLGDEIYEYVKEHQYEMCPDLDSNYWLSLKI